MNIEKAIEMLRETQENNSCSTCVIKDKCEADCIDAYSLAIEALREKQEWQKKRQKYEKIRNEILNKEFEPSDDGDPENCEQYCGDCPHRICALKPSGDILNGTNYTKLTLRNEVTGKEIAVITNDEITTADSDIVVALTPKYD